VGEVWVEEAHIISFGPRCVFEEVKLHNQCYSSLRGRCYATDGVSRAPRCQTPYRETRSIAIDLYEKQHPFRKFTRPSRYPKSRSTAQSKPGKETSNPQDSQIQASKVSKTLGALQCIYLRTSWDCEHSQQTREIGVLHERLEPGHEQERAAEVGDRTIRSSACDGRETCRPSEPAPWERHGPTVA
jgi:hypothetical protein